MKKRVAPAAPLQTRNESGVAMIMVIIWSAVLLLLVLMVSQAVIAAIRPSDTNETSFRALAAAEAGVDDYRARLALVGSPASVTSAALTGWVLIPGGTDNAYFTYRLIDDQSLNTGEIKVRSTGWVAGVTRTVDAVLRKRTSYDYGYVSGNETVPGDFPDAYSGKGGELTPDQAEAFCSKQWFEPALKSTASTELGPHRNSRICEFVAVEGNDRWYGDVHTNDVWYLGPNLDNTFEGVVTSSCPDGDGVEGCPPSHRWIDPSVVPPGNASNPSDYLLNEIPVTTEVAWNPQYAPPLELPPTPAELAARAQASGCYFTGPTRIRWHPGGVLVVTSPDTEDASINAFCREQGKSYFATDPNDQTTMVLDYDSMVAAGFNGVIYVADAASTSVPSCATKSTGTLYPFVIPSNQVYSELDSYAFPPSESLITSGSPFGLPVASTSPSKDPWVGYNLSGGRQPLATCSSGLAYVQGAYRGELTLASESDIVITGQLWDENLVDGNWTQPFDAIGQSVRDYGVPPADSANVLGLIPQGYLYVYLPASEDGGNTWRTTNLDNLAINAAALVLNGCFAVQDFDVTVDRGVLKFVGSLAQEHRCTIEKPSGNGGYEPFTVYYDDRLAKTIAPPGVSDLFREPWRQIRISEVNPALVGDLPAGP